ncbi:Crp/Fnr family transcriptional regulator [Mucilaginibacter achroorhodeus]|uniref:Crp/Fnr family transcriptional regulator n=1 Tax=Mucilaginibacter achroorhodeus TaxID=2599294 RepID=A0A563U5Z8_9SPHI|nr:Crp/Fnr family transcriptional regulator [Mucilaginibacter achroorhodeus]TWR26771.1 Crp/Fnr family transcriptional regulator [Mucilaginibacter achroorhodeus]
MNADKLLNLLNFIAPFSAALDQRFRDTLKEEHHQKGYLLLREGETSRKIYFINKGFARAFHYNGDKECTTWFMGEGDLMISVYSFYTQQPAPENIELLADSALLSMTWNQLQSIYADFPEYNYIGRIVTEKYYMMSEERTIILRTMSAAQRYNLLLKKYPQVLLNAKLSQVASFLGITPETLSRVRARKTVLT